MSSVLYQYPFGLDTITLDFGVVDSDHPNGHRGVDFAPAGGGALRAVSDGVVVRNEYQSALGWVVTVRAADGCYWSFCHMASQSPIPVGSAVTRGTVMGAVGNTGTAALGRHLHFTMSGMSSDPGTGPVFDPITYISTRLKPKRGLHNMEYRYIWDGANRFALIHPEVIKDGAIVTTNTDEANGFSVHAGSVAGGSASPVQWTPALFDAEIALAKRLYALAKAERPAGGSGTPGAPADNTAILAALEALTTAVKAKPNAPSAEAIAKAIIAEQKLPGN